MKETPVRLLGWEDPVEKGQATHSNVLGLPWWLSGKESACNEGDLGLIPGLGRSPGDWKGYPLQYSCLENPHGQRNLAGYSLWGHKESDTTEQLLLWSQGPTLSLIDYLALITSATVLIFNNYF